MVDAQYDVIIVGGASAGLSAALYTSRQGLRTLIITKDIGGQALLTDSIENYPGFLNVGGSELMNLLKKQVEKYGTTFAYEEVTKLNYAEDSCFEIVTNRASYETCALILAFGKTPRDLGVPGEEEMKGKGVSYCAICDGPLFRDKVVAVVGSGNHALEATVMLEGIARKVYMVHRGQKPVGDISTIERLHASEKVEFVGSSQVKELRGDKKIRKIVVKQDSSDSSRDIDVDGVFVEMGYVTRTGFLEGMVALNGLGEIVVNKDGTTSMPGIFAAGDITDIPFKQAVISAGMGATAALSAYNYVQKIKGKPTTRNDWKKISTEDKKDEGVSLFLH